MAEQQEQPVLEPVVALPVNLMQELSPPVGLKEAALDSPSFRATTIHFTEQVEAVEKWLETYVKSISKLSNEISSVETVVTGFLTNTAVPSNLSEAILDHDYSLLAARRFGEGAQSFWSSVLAGWKRLENTMVEPIRGFLQNDLRAFKDKRRQLVENQRYYDQLQSRYSSQKKTQEVSSLREDAFQLHEARKSYLRASMDLSVATPELRAALDRMLVKVFSDQAQVLRTARESDTLSFSQWTSELERIRGWSREMENGERLFHRELHAARKQIEESAEVASRPSRELEDYSVSSTTAKGPTSTISMDKAGVPQVEKQGWLNLRTVTGKPTRTVWLRRWFYVKNGIFGWLVQDARSGAVLESDRIGVLLCAVRVASQEERRFCFEVKTKDRTVALQAETQPELTEWMNTFQAAKQKALEDPGSTDGAIAGSQVIDPAFAISVPVVPEFTAPSDAGVQQAEEGNERSVSLAVHGNDGPSLRASFDVGIGRRSTGFEESTREQAARIVQKLKSAGGQSSGANASTSGSIPGSTSTGGIASLISASHMSIPVVPGGMPSPSVPELGARGLGAGLRATTSSALRALPSSTLAPATLTIPPNPTNLSFAAVMINEERAIVVGRPDGTGAMPSGLLANIWGSSNWGYINRVERGEVQPTKALKLESIKDFKTGDGSTDTKQEVEDNLIAKDDLAARSRTSSVNHRKTLSLDDEEAILRRSLAAKQDFPPNYPAQLKHQDAQFRLLFPNINPNEKLLLVFCASWSASDDQEFPGRAYITDKSVYFYSNHLGLVLVSGFGLDQILEVTAAPGRDCDFLFLHLKHEKIGYTRVTIKTFLEPLRLLQRRLNLLVHNCNTGKTQSLEAVVGALLRLEDGEGGRTSSLESWEETMMPARHRRITSGRSGRDLRAKIIVDQGLTVGSRDVQKEAVKFKLPSKPVVYVPDGKTTATVERLFEISTKALFHVLFGDRSAVWQLLYHERRAQGFKQGPWVQEEGVHMRRAFEYRVEYMDMLGRNHQVNIVDTQMIDVMNDHLCYVTTDRKTPWHLPWAQCYTLVTKIVITHRAKSKCKLAVFTQVDWKHKPLLAHALVEKAALRDLELDAIELADVITDQVRKLGVHSRTGKAAQIFGPVGQQTQVVEFGESNATGLAQKRRPLVRRTILRLVLEAIGSFLVDVSATLIQWTLGLLQWFFGIFSAHHVILVFLALSIGTNLVFSSRETSEWWKERGARHYMGKLGIGPDMRMSKVIAVRDLELATAMDAQLVEGLAGQCFQTFQAATALAPVGSTTPSPAARRLQRTRNQLGTYRHDLMVAMRVVNRIESELMQTEWERWVRGELGRCARMEEMLARRNGSEVEGLESVKERLLGFCGSCREAERGAVERASLGRDSVRRATGSCR